jgi:biopolymer transport protein ExbB
MVIGLIMSVSQDGGEVPGASATESPDTTLWHYLSSSGVVGVVLLALSICAVALVIMQMYGFRRVKLAPPEIVDGLSRLMRDGDWDSALMACRAPENDCYLARIFASAINRCGKSSFGMFEMRKALEDAAQRETEKLYRQTDLIGLIAALGPMLGLLGTVFGMIGAFGSISELEGAARSRELASFMAMALVNTAQGLAVAIPCTAAFSLLRRRIEKIVTEVAEICEDMTATASSGAKAPSPVRPVVRTPSSTIVPPRS